jgi:hypothetical protein
MVRAGTEEENMRKVIWLALMMCLAVMVLLGGSLPASAAMKMKWKAVSHITKVELMHVQDAKDHIMGIYEHKGIALFDDGQAGAFLDRGSFDMYVPTGSHGGYVKISFNDGSTIEFKYQGTEYRKPGIDLPFIKGTGSFINGSGRFANIKGTLSYDGGYITPYDEETKSTGDSVVEYQATYTLGK